MRYKFIRFCFSLNPENHRIGNSSNILCSRCREQDESNLNFIFHCKLFKTTLNFIIGLININYNFSISFKFSPKPKAIINGVFISQFYDSVYSEILLTPLDRFLRHFIEFLISRNSELLLLS